MQFVQKQTHWNVRFGTGCIRSHVLECSRKGGLKRNEPNISCLTQLALKYMPDEFILDYKYVVFKKFGTNIYR